MLKIATRVSLAIVVTLLGLNFTPTIVHSARGTPDSPDFGYGLVLDLDGKNALDSVQYAATMSVDWLAIPFNWAKRWPDPTQQPNLADLDQAMVLAGQYNLPVMIKLISAPGWASTNQGPSPERTAWFAINLARRYPGILQAVELFPGANTLSGWGAAPDAQDYLKLFNYTRAAIKEAKLSSPIILVAAGLIPLPVQNSSPTDQDDLTFLNALYQSGAARTMSVVSVELQDLTGDPWAVPDGNEHRILRHYEEIRQVMLANHHSQGILWITGFHWPSGHISPDDVALSGNLSAQNKWLIKAYQQLRSQLYIGTAFFETLNPPGDERAAQTGNISLIGSGLSLHPFVNSLMEITVQNNRLLSPPLTFNHPQSKHILKDRTNPP